MTEPNIWWLLYCTAAALIAAPFWAYIAQLDRKESASAVGPLHPISFVMLSMMGPVLITAIAIAATIITAFEHRRTA